MTLKNASSTRMFLTHCIGLCLRIIRLALIGRNPLCGTTISNRRKLWRFEHLEERALLASFAGSGSELTITLNTANESIGIVAGSTSVTLTDTGGTWSGTNNPAVTGNGTNQLTITSTGLNTYTSVRIFDSASNTSVNFNNSGSNAYVQRYAVFLGNSAAGSIQFNGNTTFTGAGNSISASTSGNVTVNSGAMIKTSTGSVDLAATGLNKTVAMNGSIFTVGGGVSLRATGNITIAANQSISSGYGATSLQADVGSSGSGDDGIGTLTIGANAIVYGGDVSLRGADQEIAATATLEAAGFVLPTVSSTLTGLSGAHGVVFDSNGSMYVANRTVSSISKFSPGATAPSATLTGVSSPHSMVFDSSGNLYVSNLTSNTISKFAPGATSPTTTLTGLSRPAGMVIDGAGNLYVANATGSGVSKFSAGATTASSTLTVTGNDRPQDIALDSAGNLFVSSPSLNAVMVYAPGATTPFRTINGLSNPQGIRFDALGNLFVANFGNATVYRYAPGATTPSATLTGVAGPAAMLFDSLGNLHVVNESNNTVSKFAPNATTPSVTFTGLTSARGLAFDSETNLYVSDSNVVSKFNAATYSQAIFQSSVNSRPMSIGGTNTAVAGVNLTDAELARVITIAKGVVYFGGSSQTGNISVVTASPATTSGTSIRIVQSTTGSGRIILDDGSGSATALDGKSGSLFLNAGTGGISSLSANNSTPEIATKGSTVSLESSGFIGTVSNRIQFANNLDSGQQRVSSGTSSTTYSSGIYLDGLGALTLGSLQALRFSAPIDVTARGHLVVTGSMSSGSGHMRLAADSTPSRSGDDGVGVLTISSNTAVYGNSVSLKAADLEVGANASVQAAGNLGANPEYSITGVSGARNMVVDSNGNLFVANSNTNTVSKFAPGATTPSATLIGLNGPHGLIFDSAGNLYVSNYGLGSGTTVSKFAPGAIVPTATLTSNGQSGPNEMAFDSAGNLFVAYYSTNVVARYAPGATSPSSMITSVNRPSGLATDSSGNLFVSNRFSNNIGRYAPGATVPNQVLTGVDSPGVLVMDANDNLFVANYYRVTKFNAGSTVPSNTLTLQNPPNDLALDALGNLFVADMTNIVKKFAPGASFPSAEFNGTGFHLVVDPLGNLYVNNSSGTVNKFNPASPGFSVVSVESSLGSRPMTLGGLNNAVSGINLADAELSRVITPSSGQILFGNSDQSGNIDVVTATLATTPGTPVFVEQSQTSAGRITLDNASGTAPALSANLGSITLTSGTGSIVAAPTNTNSALDIINATSTSLTSRGVIGTIAQPLQLAATTLTTRTAASNGGQYLKSSGTIKVGALGLNANTGTISLAGGVFEIESGRTITGSVHVNEGSTLTGFGVVSGAVTINTGGTINPGYLIGPGSLRVNSLAFNGGTYAADYEESLNDMINVEGSVNLNAGTPGILIINSAIGPVRRGPLTLINKIGGSPITNAPLVNAADGAAVLVNGTTTRASYFGDFDFSGTNNDFVLYPIISTPTDVSLYSIVNAENSPTDSYFGFFLSTDSDPEDAFTYSLVPGPGDTDNALFLTNGEELRNSSILDFETKSNYSIRVRTTDLSGRSFEKAFTISISDVNEAPTNLVLSKSSIAENLFPGSDVGLLSAVDPDAESFLTYTILAVPGNTDHEKFSIDGNTLKANAVFDFELKNAYQLMVRVTDNGRLFYDAPLIITIENEIERTTPVQIGDGSVQRSVVNQLVVSFDQAIEFDAGAFQVYQRISTVNDPRQLVPVTTLVALNPTVSGMTATLTFSGALTRQGTNALVDGNYELHINGSLIRIVNSTKTFDADGDGIGGGYYQLGNQRLDNFFALLGDANGNGEVDAQDLLGAKTGFRKTVGQSGYKLAYDINGNGLIDAQDILNIQSSLRKKRALFLSPPT